MEYGFIPSGGKRDYRKGILPVNTNLLFCRIYVVWRNILNFSTDHQSQQPSKISYFLSTEHYSKLSNISVLSWTTLLYYIRNLKKSGSNEAVKQLPNDKYSVSINETENDVSLGKWRLPQTLNPI